MKKMIMTLAALAVGMTAGAEEFPYLSFETTDGSVVSVIADGLQMVFADGLLKVSTADGEKQFAVADLSRMFFSASATTAIKELNADGQTNGMKAVYSASGTYLGTVRSMEEIKEMSGKGLYIIRDNNNTTKTMVK